MYTNQEVSNRLRKDKAYRANPTNMYHKEYQTSMNRWVCFGLIVILLLSCFIKYGVIDVLLTFGVLAMIASVIALLRVVIYVLVQYLNNG